MAASIEDNEEAVVAKFLDNIRNFNYDKAKDIADKQKEICKHNANAVPALWPAILNVLSQLAVAEKSYSSFLYLSPKWFGRKDAKGTYDLVAQECRKIEELGMNGKLSALAHICGQLVAYVQLKCDMIEFFSSLHEMTSVKFCDRSDLLLKIKNVLRTSSNKFYHPQLEPLKSAFITECSVIEQLLEAHIAMSQWRFVDSLLHLQESHNQISRLHSNTASTSKESWKNAFLGMKTPVTPVLYTWLKQFKDAIYSKFTLYFYDVLSQQAPHGDMKAYLSRCTIDYYSKLVTFSKKTDAFLISLVFNSEGLEVQGPGYTEPSEEAVLTYLPEPHQTFLIMSLSCKEKQLNQSDKPVDLYDEKNTSTYFISRIDPTVHLVVVYKSKKSDREKKTLVSFLQEISSQLRYTKLFHDLRPS